MANFVSLNRADTNKDGELTLSELKQAFKKRGQRLFNPPTAAELSGAELLAMAGGVSDAEFEAEASAWTAARGADAAARELLELAAEAEPGERMLAVAAVTGIGAPAEAAWRLSLRVPAHRLDVLDLNSRPGIDRFKAFKALAVRYRFFDRK